MKDRTELYNFLAYFFLLLSHIKRYLKGIYENNNIFLRKMKEFLSKCNTIRNDINNYLLDDETNLWARMKYDNKKMDVKIRGEMDEILYFLNDFNEHSINNQAERDQRNAKRNKK